MKRKRIRPPKCCDRAPTPRDITRLLARVKVCPDKGCWIWQGHRDDKGYGQMHYGGRAHWTHRLAWIFFRGRIPAGKTVHHKRCCLETSCCNPAHLRPLTNGANAAEGNRRRSQECPI